MARPPHAGNPFTNPLSNARLHANPNAAFMRATRPGSAGDGGDVGGSGFSSTGEAHRHDPNHPDATLIPGWNRKLKPLPVVPPSTL